MTHTFICDGLSLGACGSVICEQWLGFRTHHRQCMCQGSAPAALTALMVRFDSARSSCFGWVSVGTDTYLGILHVRLVVRLTVSQCIAISRRNHSLRTVSDGRYPQHPLFGMCGAVVFRRVPTYETGWKGRKLFNREFQRADRSDDTYL